MSRLRRSEWLIVVYFLYVAVVGSWFRLGWKPWALAAGVTAAVWALALTKTYTRDFAPLVFTFLAYREMDWFAPALHTHRLEHTWIVWDRWLLDDLHLRAVIESAGAWFPTYFEICYVMVYAVAPVSVGLLLWNHRRARISQFWFAYLAGTLGAYALFPFFPSEPPRIVFAGADLPRVVTLVRQLNLWILGGYGIHSSVFPSAHVSSALSAAWGLMATIPERRWIGGLMAVYAISVAIATIYGRYHYAADAAAGIVISLLALAALKRERVY